MGRVSAKKRYKHRLNARNAFTAKTGLVAFEMHGGSGCIIVDYDTILGEACERYAFKVYNNFKFRLNRGVTIWHTCGVKNCVKEEHLRARFEPTKKDREYIEENKGSIGWEQLAHMLRVPRKLWLDSGLANG